MTAGLPNFMDFALCVNSFLQKTCVLHLCFLHNSIKMITVKREKLLSPEAQEWILASMHADSTLAPVSETTSSGFWPLAFSTAEVYGELELVKEKMFLFEIKLHSVPKFLLLLQSSPCLPPTLKLKAFFSD